MISPSLRLAVNPFLTVRKAEKHLGVAYNTAALAIRQLQQEGVVVQKGEARRDRVFCAQALLDILEEPPKLTARQPASFEQKRASRKSRT